MLTAPAVVLLIQAISTGSITGTLRDAGTNDGLSGALVAVIDLNRTAVTDADGRYRLDRLPPGTHRLLVRRIGYAPRTLEALVPTDGTVEITIALRPEPVLLGAIEGSEPGGAGGGPAADRQIEIAALRNHALLAEPDAFQALNRGIVGVQPEAPAGMHVRGGASDQVSYLLDGFPVFSPYHSGESFSAWNADALATVELQPASETWDALSGVVSAASRAPGNEHHVQTGFSTTHMRLTLDGPLGSRGGGYLWSERSGFLGFPAPQRETTYLRGETGDRLVKLEAPLLGGRLRILGYASANELDTDGPAGSANRNMFDWQSTTIGGEWRRPLAGGVLRARVWTAGGNANAGWLIDSTTERLATRRRDAGLAVTIETAGQHGRTSVGTRVQSSHMVYRQWADAGTTIQYDSDAPLAALFVERTQSIGRHASLLSAIAATGSAGATRLSPRATVYWSPAGGLVVSGGYLRLYQFAQSLRNPESVAGAVFPVDLHVGAGQSGVPIACTDEGIVTVDFRPVTGTQVTAQGYVRAFHDVVLVAPRSRDPFATSPFAVGAGAARGVTLELTRTTARYAFVASYGRQHVRFAYDRKTYRPDYGATHALDAGIMVRASRGGALSLRAAVSGRFGRHVTAVVTPFEWESCNITDRGCEFAGSPRTNTDSLGATTLPDYLRLDLGIRRQWNVRLAGRPTTLAVFGTLTNVLGRSNVLTIAPDPLTGSRSPVTLRSRVPLLIGVDWTF